MTTDTITEEAVYDDPHDELPPPRPRRKRLARSTFALLALLIAACGFIGGVQVQKGQQQDGQAGGFPGGLSGPPTGGGLAAAGGGAVTGEVANVKGKTLYVTTADGDTVAVKPTSSSTITRNADAGIGAIRPGDNVVVQGAEKASGAVEATSIAATAAGVDAVGAFMRPPTSASGENGDETSGDVDALFQP